MSNDDLKEHVNSSHDFYALLGLEVSSSESEIRRAYRKTALKYHPDKVGANDKAALDKFHLLQIAYDVLSDASVKELYDNARRAREEKKARQSAFEGRRKAMMDELERRETGAVKRKRDEMDEEEQFERELRRLAEDGKRRRKEREDQLRKDALAMEEQERKQDTQSGPQTGNETISDIDRSVTFRFPRGDKTAHLDQGHITKLFSQFGVVEGAVLRDKRLKPPGAKHKQDYVSVVLVYQSIVGAHAAVSDFERLKGQNADFHLLEAVGWASGKAPQSVPEAQVTLVSQSPEALAEVPDKPKGRDVSIGHTTTDSLPKPTSDATRNPAKPPSFAFKKPTQAANGATVDEVMMMRLKNAEKRRLEAKIRQDEAGMAAKVDL